jgi:hypothetical protein
MKPGTRVRPIMTLTIDLPPETEQKLLARAAATGKDVATLVREAVEEKLRAPSSTFAELLAPIHEDFRKSGMTETELDSLLERALAETRLGRRQPRGDGS